ncbi:MAG: hypothetical protein Q4C34_09750 [Bacteroidales bacterium]|nr:hypothetical protein [Bacteroidales bacterium]
MKKFLLFVVMSFVMVLTGRAADFVTEKYIIKEKEVEKVAPVITFSVPEGNVEGESVDVQILLNEDVYPEADVYFTIDGKRAHIDHKDACKHRYTLGQTITLTKPANGNQVTINAHAVNEAGHHTHAATYTFGAVNEPGESTTTWELVTDASVLKENDQIVFGQIYHYQSSKNDKYFQVIANIDKSLSDISGYDVDTYAITETQMIKDPLVFTLKSSGSSWKLETADGMQLTAPTGSAKTGMNFTNNGTATTVDIDVDKHIATVKFGDYTIYCNFVSNKGAWAPVINGFKNSQKTPQYIQPFIWRKQTITKPGNVITPAHDYYLVMDENLWDGGAETVVPFSYNEIDGYTLDVKTIASSTNEKPGFSGVFYVRDGKANHAGHYFEAAQDVTVDKARAQVLSDGNVDFIPDESGNAEVNLKFVDNSANPVQPNAPVHAIQSKLSTNYGSGYLSINEGTLKLTVDGDNSKLQIGRAVVTGIESVVADSDTAVEYYNLQGVRVTNPANGIYICRRGNTATKVYVK